MHSTCTWMTEINTYPILEDVHKDSWSIAIQMCPFLPEVTAFPLSKRVHFRPSPLERLHYSQISQRTWKSENYEPLFLAKNLENFHPNSSEPGRQRRTKIDYSRYKPFFSPRLSLFFSLSGRKWIRRKRLFPRWKILSNFSCRQKCRADLFAKITFTFLVASTGLVYIRRRFILLLFFFFAYPFPFISHTF